MKATWIGTPIEHHHHHFFSVFFLFFCVFCFSLSDGIFRRDNVSMFLLGNARTNFPKQLLCGRQKLKPHNRILHFRCDAIRLFSFSRIDVSLFTWFALSFQLELIFVYANQMRFEREIYALECVYNQRFNSQFKTE